MKAISYLASFYNVNILMQSIDYISIYIKKPPRHPDEVEKILIFKVYIVKLSFDKMIITNMFIIK